MELTLIGPPTTIRIVGIVPIVFMTVLANYPQLLTIAGSKPIGEIVNDIQTNKNFLKP